MDDQKLVAALISKKAWAWKGFLTEYGPQIVSSCFYTLKRHSGKDDIHLAEDIAQVVFIELSKDDYKALRNFKFHSKLSTWLVAIARNQTLMHLRKKEITTKAFFEEVPAPVGDSEMVSSAIKSLPERDSKLLQLYYFDNRSFKDIASELQISVNSVSPLLMRARERLRDILVK